MCVAWSVAATILVTFLPRSLPEPPERFLLSDFFESFSESNSDCSSPLLSDFSESELLSEMTSYVEQGIPRVKMKVGKNFLKNV